MSIHEQVVIEARDRCVADALLAVHTHACGERAGPADQIAAERPQSVDAVHTAERAQPSSSMRSTTSSTRRSVVSDLLRVLPPVACEQHRRRLAPPDRCESVGADAKSRRPPLRPLATVATRYTFTLRAADERCRFATSITTSPSLTSPRLPLAHHFTHRRVPRQRREHAVDPRVANRRT